MANKKITIIIGHPDKNTYCGELARRYEKGALSSGHEVRMIAVGDLQFDPILHHGYKVIQPLEPDLIKVQEDIKWADHLVIVYPNWWGTMPALMKGMLDRMLLPGFAFRFHKTGYLWDKLLAGRSAHVYVTMDSPPLINRIIFGDNINEIKRDILGFIGFHPVYVTKIGAIKNMSDEERIEWLAKLEKHGKREI
jgi:putative NADPH-quinone reductase